jgi:type IV pilus assembly protein PilB
MNLTLLSKPLGQILLGRGVVAPAQLEMALSEQRQAAGKRLLGEILVDSHLCSESQIAEALADSYGVPFARVSPRLADPKVVTLLPRHFLEREQVLPLFLVEGMLTVAVVEPANLFLLDEIRRLTGHKVQPVAATAADIRDTLRASGQDGGAFVCDDAGCDAAPESFSVVARPGASPPAVADSDAPVQRLLRACLYTAIGQSATDIHIEPDETAGRVRYRIDGRLAEWMRIAAQTHVALVAQLKTLAGMDAARRPPADGVIRVRMDRRVIELRLSAAPVAHGEKLVVRIGDGARSPLRLEKLGFGYETLKQWRRLIGAGRGLLLVTGPAGSGKRTTLCATLAELDAETLNLCTIEDSPERTLPGVNQVRVVETGGYSRAAALRTVLSQDPDVVMLPELSDPEAARVAAAGAMAGPLMLCGVHTADVAAAVHTLLAMGIQPLVAGSVLAGVLAQRLVRRLCPQCRESCDATATERKQLERFAGPVTTLYRPKGCNHCRNTGYAGRIGLFELLTPTDALADAIFRGAGRAEVAQVIQQTGMRPLKTDGAEKVKAGITTLEEFLCAGGGT